MINKYPEYKEVDLSTIPDGDPLRGIELYDNHCAGCHNRDPASAYEPQGPMLFGFLGKKAGFNDKSYDYSTPLKESNIVWNRITMHIFLYAPVVMVPGTAMKIWGIQNQQDRADIIEYLYSQPEFVSRQVKEDQEKYDMLHEINKKKKKKKKVSGDMEGFQ